MRTVQMTLDEPLLQRVDEAAGKLKTSRSAFTRKALQIALNQLAVREKEQVHRQGYERYPVQAGEFDIWEDEQVWPD